MTTTNKPLTDASGEAREITTADMKLFRPATEALPAGLQAKLGMRGRGPQRAPVKERISIRLSADVVASFRATGPGWQGRMDEALQDWLKTHEPA